MAQGRLHMIMPGTAAAAFEAFHNHALRLQWDTLLAVAYVEGGGSHPYVGAITVNWGKGWKRLLGMRTRFVSYEPPRLAAAVLLEPIGLFAHWAASLRHRDLGDGRSELDYAFHIRLRPRWLGWMFDPLAAWVFARETRKRFAAMAAHLERNR